MQLGPCSWSAPHVSVAMNINLAVMTLSIVYRRRRDPSSHSNWNFLSILFYLADHYFFSLVSWPLHDIQQIGKHYKKHYITQPAPRNIRNRQKKFDGNINKRGQVPIGKASEHTDDPAISKGLIAFFMFVVIGSSFVQILRMFQTSVPNLSE